MAIRILVTLEDTAPVLPFVDPILATIIMDSEGMETLVDPLGVVDRAGLQSYLMLATTPLADEYELIISNAPVVLDDDDFLIAEEIAEPPPPTPERLPLTIAEYDYVKPDGGVPLAAQIVQGNLTLKTISVSIMDNTGIDQTATLELVLPGDTIAIGATTWAVDAGAYNVGPIDEPGWYDFLVTPAEQSADSGIVSVTFAPKPDVVPVPIPPTPLPTTAISYSYLKPDTDGPHSPAAGQIVQANLSVDTLRVSRIDQAAVDQSAVLDLVIAGDTISMDDSVWTVSLVSPTAEWIDFLVAPATQNDDEGVFDATFERPLMRRRS